MSSSSLVAVRCPWGPSALRSRDIGRQASFLALRYPSRDPESRHCELIAALWRFPADVGETRGCDVFATSEQKNGLMDRCHKNTRSPHGVVTKLIKGAAVG